MRYKKNCILALAVIMIFSMTPKSNAIDAIDGNRDSDIKTHQKIDNHTDTLTIKQLELKEQALNAKLNGKAIGKIHEVAKGQFVELERDGNNAIWTVLGEFKDLKHNSIPEPDRENDNSTIWKSDFNKEYYMDTLFNDAPGANSMHNYYVEQSSNRFAIIGDVTDWIEVDGNAEVYDDNPDRNVWLFINESVDGWYNLEISKGKTPEQISSYLAQFDVWDRYDFDEDGNFDEPDGYIDTFQSVHAGEGEEAGGGMLGDKAIWSHSWYANTDLYGIEGPAFNKSGGIQIGDSDYWVGKYTIQPENGGVGVFAHEFGHDLGLPDLYDYTGENGTGFWTLMSSGSWLSDGSEDIGSRPSHMGAWEKFQLGWLNYEVTYAGQSSVHRLGPMEFNTKQAQGLFVILPKKEVVTEIGSPFNGLHFYYSGSGDNLDNYMTKSFYLSEGASLSAKVNFEIELDWDYAYLVVSTDNGATWLTVPTNFSTNENPNGQNFGNGITGASDDWEELTADLSAFGNQEVKLGFRYWTDVAATEKGLMIDDITISGFDVDGAETDAGWTFTGFKISTGTESALFNHYYVAEYRTFMGYDSSLKLGPYYFGYSDYINKVDRFSYQDGLLINYWDTSQNDNNTGDHPGKGLLLTIDAHYQALYRSDGELWRNRIQTYDATFSKYPTDGISNIHHEGVLSVVPSLPGVKVFDDSILHYDAYNIMGSVMHPNTGTIISIMQEPSMKMLSAQVPFMQIQVGTAKIRTEKK